MTQVRITTLAVDAEGEPVVILKPVDDAPGHGLLLPIWIGPMETAAILIAMGATGQPARPLTYDLLVSLLEACEATVERVEVTQLVEGTFHAAITLHTPAGTRIVDARPSDSIALALRVGAPTFVADDVLSAAGIPDSAERAEQDIAEFGEFLDTVDPEDFAN